MGWLGLSRLKTIGDVDDDPYAPSPARSVADAPVTPPISRSTAPATPDPYSPPAASLNAPAPITSKYQSQLNDVGQKLEAAEAYKPIGGFRAAVAGLLSARAPALANVISGDYQRKRQIAPLQEQYNTLAGLNNADRAQQLQDSTVGKNDAETDYHRAQITALTSPKPAEEDWSVVTGAEGPNGEPIQQEKHSGQVRVAPLPGASMKTKSTPAKVTYDSGIPVSVTGTDGKTYDVNDPALPAELKPLVASAQSAHKQHETEQEQSQMRVQGAAASRQAQTFAQQEKMFQEHQDAPTAATKSMIESAPKVKALIAKLMPMVDSETQGSGALGARWSDFWNNKVGAPNPAYNKMRVDDGLLSTALMKMHFGSKGGEQAMEHFSNLLGLGHQSPENYKAALEAIDEYADTVGGESHGGPNPSNLKGAAPAATNSKDPLGIL